MGKYKVTEYIYEGEKYPENIEFDKLLDRQNVIKEIKEKHNLNGHAVYLVFKQMDRTFKSYEEASV